MNVDDTQLRTALGKPFRPCAESRLRLTTARLWQRFLKLSAASVPTVCSVAVFCTAYLPTAHSPAVANQGNAWELDSPPTAYSADYVVGNDIIEAGEATVSLTPINANNTWRYSLKTNPTGLFKLAGKGRVQENSEFKIVKNDLSYIIQPQAYTFRQDEEKKRAIDAEFDWENNVLTFQRGSDQDTVTLEEGTLDRMTMTVTMMNTLTPNFDSYTLNVFDGGRLKQVELVNEGSETIETSLGTLQTVRVRTRNANSSRRETMTWFAPSLNNLPVRIEQLKDGDLVARLSISRYTGSN